METIHDALRHTDVKLTEGSSTRGPSAGSRKLAPAFEFGSAAPSSRRRRQLGKARSSGESAVGRDEPRNLGAL